MRLGLKVLLVLGMTLAILIPLTMIRGVIHERQTYRAQAVERVARSFAGAQSFAGPVLVVPYTEVVEVEEKNPYGQVVTRRIEKAGEWTFFPDTLEVGGHLKPGVREVGLHKVRVYEWQGRASAAFAIEIPAAGEHQRRIGRPWLRYGLGDVRGLVGSPRLQVNDRDLRLQEGLGGGDGGSGVHVRLSVPRAGQSLQLQTRLDFVLAGTESLALVPLGRSNHFTLDSSWPHPGFGGNFLPRVREIGSDGFKAEWQVSSLATTAQAQYLKSGPEAAAGAGLDAAELRLVDPVNVYSQADRASKYGVLFVLLTFLGFFMFELVKQLRIHPIQYALVGLAIAIFFLLLVSLSEHLAFGWSYLASSVACIGLIAFYLSSVLHSVVRGLGFATMLATLYAALYGLLVSEDNALVLGAGLLFLILAMLMVVTRKVDWYRIAGNPR